MNLQEQIKKAFNAGCDYVIDNSYTEEDTDWVVSPSNADIEIACNEYINNESLADGNEQSI